MHAAIARASACHMSNAKWQKLFAALRESGVGMLRWKFVRDERVFMQPVPPLHAVLERSLGDVLPSPYSAYSEIEWIEVPTEDAVGVVESLGAVAKFPIQQCDTGVRITAYTW